MTRKQEAGAASTASWTADVVEQAVLDLRGETTELLDCIKALAAKVRWHRARASLADRAA